MMENPFQGTSSDPHHQEVIEHLRSVTGDANVSGDLAFHSQLVENFGTPLFTLNHRSR